MGEEMLAGLDKRPRGSLTTRVTDWIRQAILDGEIDLGDALSEDKLAMALGVSRSPVRQALAILEQQGLIDVRPQRGSFVFRPNQEDINKLCEFRRMVEVDALRLAMLRNRAPTLAAMKAAAERMEVAREDGDRRRMARADDDFHDALLANCGNPYLINAYGLFSGKVAALRWHHSTMPTSSTANAEHFAMVAMLEEGDLQGALDMLDIHVMRMADRFEEGLLAHPSCTQNHDHVAPLPR